MIDTTNGNYRNWQRFRLIREEDGAVLAYHKDREPVERSRAAMRCGVIVDTQQPEGEA